MSDSTQMLDEISAELAHEGAVNNLVDSSQFYFKRPNTEREKVAASAQAELAALSHLIPEDLLAELEKRMHENDWAQVARDIVSLLEIQNRWGTIDPMKLKEISYDIAKLVAES